MGLLNVISQVVRRPVWVAATLALVLLAALPGIARLDPHHDVIGSFAQSLGQPVPQAASQLVVAVHLTAPGAVAELDVPAQAMRRVDGVVRVDTPPDPSLWTAEAPDALYDDVVQTVLGSVDSRWAPIVVRLRPDAPHSTVASLREVLSASTASQWAMAGPPVSRLAQQEVVNSEQLRLLAITCLVLAVCLWVLCRRVWGVVIPLLAVASACVLLAGVIGWSGRGLGGPNVLLLPLVVVLGLSDSVYLLRAVVRIRAAGEATHTTLVQALRRTAPACAMTTATTALGFAVLALSSSPSLREFGVFAAVGVTLALFTGLGVPTLALAMAPQLDVDADRRSDSPVWFRLACWVSAPGRRVRSMLVTTSVCVALAAVGLAAGTDLRVNGALPTSHWARTEAQTVDRVLGGLIDVVVRVDTLRPGGTASVDAFDALVRLQRDIASDPSVGRAFSFADAALWVGRQAGVTPDALTGSARMTAARRGRRFAPYYDAASAIAASHQGLPLLSDDGRGYVVYVRLRDTGAQAWSVLLDIVADRDAAEPSVRVQSEGTVLFFDAARQQISADATRIVGASIATSLIVLAVAFRRWRAVVAAAIVLAGTGLAALAVFGASGLGVQRLHLFAFSTALGVGIDPMVHLHATLRRRLRVGGKHPLRDALLDCAVPIYRTWLVLTVGLLCLFVSRVPEIREVGAVLAVAFAANLLATATVFVAALAHSHPTDGDEQRHCAPARAHTRDGVRLRSIRD